MEHRDGGANRVLLGHDAKGDKALEKEVHAEQRCKLGGMLRQKRPDLEVELLPMVLDGSAEMIPLVA